MSTLSVEVVVELETVAKITKNKNKISKSFYKIN
jgi:hypothetical protein